MDTNLSTSLNYQIFMISNIIICLVCIWAALSHKVNDGLFGHISIIFIAFSSIANMGWAYYFPLSINQSNTIFCLAIACMCGRCFYIKTSKRKIHHKIVKLKKDGRGE